MPVTVACQRGVSLLLYRLNWSPRPARTWSRRGTTPVATVSGKGSGRMPVAGLVCFQPGRRRSALSGRPAPG